MNKIFTTIIVFVVTIFNINGQNPGTGDINPFVNAIAYTPTNSSGYSPGTFTCGASFNVTFNIGQTTSNYSMPPQATDPVTPSNPIALTSTTALKLDIIITNLTFNGTVTIGGSANAVVTGSYASFFTWTFATANRIRGVQSTIIPPFSVFPAAGAGQIKVAIAVPNQGNCTSCMIINSTLLIPSYINQATSPVDQTADDAVQTNASFNCRSLPIQLLNFQSISKEISGIGLHWKTLNELNTAMFEIQRMYEGGNNTWMTVGRTKAAGYSQKELTYDYMDKSYARAEKIYYRIKQVDEDGSSKYTDIKSIQLKEYNKLQLNGYPNPVNETYHLNLNVKEDSDLSVELIDILGRSVSKESIQAKTGFNNHDIHFGGLSGGTYFIKVTGAEMNNSLTVVKID